MAKTSIFSQKYDKKRRQKKRIIKLALVLLFLGILFPLFRTPIMDKVNKVKQDITDENLVIETPENNEEPIVAETPVETPVEKKIFTSFTLEEDTLISFEMEENETGLVFKVPEVNEGYEVDLSKDRTKILILDRDSQELYLAKANGEYENITYRIYKSSKGYTESKESILRRKPDFIWAEQPRFLDEDTVVYMSQLPWFDERKFLYIVELDPLSHRNFQSVFGTDVVLKELNETGLAYEKAGETYYFTPEYKIIKP